MSELKPVYKMVKVPKEHCPQCGEQLIGNNSQLSPWRCSCGNGLYDWVTNRWAIIPSKECMEDVEG
jgi:ribosomal protein S27AE